MAKVFSYQGEYTKALEYFGQALRIAEKAMGPEHPLLAWYLSGMGEVFVEQGRPEQALAVLERAVSICRKNTCEQEPHGRGLFHLARALVASNVQRTRAISLAGQAREAFARNRKRFEKELGEVDAWLAQHGSE